MLEAVRTRFRPGVWLTIATLATFAVLVSLGVWQLQRLAWKNALLRDAGALLAAEPVPLDQLNLADLPTFTTVEATGTLAVDRAQLFGSQSRNGLLGGRLLVPLLREDAPALLVDMGWVPENARPASLITGANEPVTIEGWISRDFRHDRPWFRPSNAPGEHRWYWKSEAQLEEALDLDLLPVSLVRLPGASRESPPIADNPSLDAIPNNHLGYAVTWFGLSGALIVIYILLATRTSATTHAKSP